MTLSKKGIIVAHEMARALVERHGESASAHARERLAAASDETERQRWSYILATTRRLWAARSGRPGV